MSERNRNDAIPIKREPTAAARPAPAPATRILDSDVIAAALRGAASEPARSDGPTSGAPPGKTFDPARTRVLDMKRLWPEVQSAAGRTLEVADSTAQPPVDSSDEGNGPPSESDDIGRRPKGIRARFRAASPRRRALAVMLPVTCVIVLARLAAPDPAPASRAPTIAPAATTATATATATATPTTTATATATATATTTTTTTATATPTATATTTARASAHKSASPRSREREAVDAVARADYPSALKLYQELAAEHPQRTVFRESARILADKIAPPVP